MVLMLVIVSECVRLLAHSSPQMQTNLTNDSITLPLGVGVAQLPALTADELSKIWSVSQEKTMQVADISTRHIAVACAFGALQVICLGVV